MDLLELVQTLHYEAKQPGSPPDTVSGQSGRAADFVRWTIEAYNDIQRAKDGRWKWLRRQFTVDTAADDPDYEFGECTDVLAAAAIDRFSSWDIDEEEPPFIYLVSEGKSAERELPLWLWSDFRRLYVRATHDSSVPAVLSRSPNDTLYLGPTPNGIYRVSGYYWRSPQALADDDDVPEMPAAYHMLIVYRALMKYGYNIIAQEILARARTEGAAMFASLIENQWYGRFRLRLPEAIA